MYWGQPVRNLSSKLFLFYTYLGLRNVALIIWKNHRYHRVKNVLLLDSATSVPLCEVVKCCTVRFAN
jgi:hypothetical protein